MKPTNPTTQTQRILRHLKRGLPITQMSAFTRYRCMRLAARIEELRGDGHRITSRTLRRNGKRYSCYRLK
jgi:hypothetical protein